MCLKYKFNFPTVHKIESFFSSLPKGMSLTEFLGSFLCVSLLNVRLGIFYHTVEFEWSAGGCALRGKVKLIFY